ncbi:F-box protein SKIP28-like [Prosopis cineraria]|uniref:F-box protein SKIP28-like n=1 Tax=Prosopis cineraria TaxID=364024 RepID=UPI00240F4B44|nr:F-box protein SKIP28-like [Prosopis cineraria]
MVFAGCFVLGFNTQLKNLFNVAQLDWNHTFASSILKFLTLINPRGGDGVTYLTRYGKVCILRDNKENKTMEEASKLSSSSSSYSCLGLTISQEKAEPPHEALFHVLPYLSVGELLAMSQVCISLRDAVNKDVLPWRNFLVQPPLSSNLSDQILLRLASKANGGLRTLALVNCTKISDYGLQRVVEENPFINKLYLPSCTGITPEGLVKAVKMLSQGSNSLSTLRINGIHNLKKEHIDMLVLSLKRNLPWEPIFYHERGNFLAFKNREEEETRRIIDLEICPMCCEVRMVYDCPRETCKKREVNLARCKACKFCIPRCENCGECLGYEETEETACADVVCCECWLKLPKCNFCNKPYCKQHIDWWCNFSESGLICRVCDIVNTCQSSDVL